MAIVMSARHRVSLNVALIIRQGIVYSGGKAWTGKHELWLRTHRFDIPGRRAGLRRGVRCLMLACVLTGGSASISAITAMAGNSAFTPVVTRLGCLRGISTLTAFGLAVEIWRRGNASTGARSARTSGWYPPRIAFGGDPFPGRGHQTGNSHARRSAGRSGHGYHRPRYRPGRELRKRWETASPAARARGQAANRRLNARWAGFDERKKRAVVANAAIARELAGWCWSLAILDE